MADGFDPNRSRTNPDTLVSWISAPMEDDITAVPGVGEATANKLADDGTWRIMTRFSSNESISYFLTHKYAIFPIFIPLIELNRHQYHLPIIFQVPIVQGHRC